MAVLHGWSFSVAQKRPDTGCIPAGIEWMLRHVGATQAVDLGSFQTEFDLDIGAWALGRPFRNDFGSVPAHVVKRYPAVALTREEFPTGLEKVQRLRALLAEGRPGLVSFAYQGGGWHIMPVVEVAEDPNGPVGLLDLATGKLFREPVGMFGVALTVNRLIEVHDTRVGGKDLLVWAGALPGP